MARSSGQPCRRRHQVLAQQLLDSRTHSRNEVERAPCLRTGVRRPDLLPVLHHGSALLKRESVFGTLARGQTLPANPRRYFCASHAALVARGTCNLSLSRHRGVDDSLPMLQKGRMLSPLQEQAIELYNSGKNLREVAAEVQRSHEWVRKTLKRAGEGARNRGREPLHRPKCVVCGSLCQKPDARFCSRPCVQRDRNRAAVERLQDALRVLRAGGTYNEAAAVIGFPNGWHLWGRLHHFGLTAGLTAPKKPASV